MWFIVITDNKILPPELRTWNLIFRRKVISAITNYQNKNKDFKAFDNEQKQVEYVGNQTRMGHCIQFCKVLRICFFFCCHWSHLKNKYCVADLYFLPHWKVNWSISNIKTKKSSRKKKYQPRHLNFTLFNRWLFLSIASHVIQTRNSYA